jgi:uncharacterized YigZ family protein
LNAPYNIPLSTAEFRLTIRGSRFLSFCSPVTDIAAAESILADRRKLHHDATHNCWAYRIGDPPSPIERSSDAGEPSGTAGPPILNALRRANLTDAIIVVSRWFGGTKLGKGGLARAYSDSASGVISLLNTETRIPLMKYTIDCTYDLIGIVEKCAAVHNARITRTEYADSARIHLEIPAAAAPAFLANLTDLASNRIRIINNE